MLDLGWQELFLIAVVALVVVGPKDLPSALRTVAGALRKARGLTREVQHGFSELVREAELEDIRRQVGGAGRGEVAKAVKDAVDPDGSLTAEFDPRAFTAELKKEVEAGPRTGPRAGAAVPRADGPAPVRQGGEPPAAEDGGAPAVTPPAAPAAVPPAAKPAAPPAAPAAAPLAAKAAAKPGREPGEAPERAAQPADRAFDPVPGAGGRKAP
jgi:sec-independent protein translocase protein TatB